MKQEADNLASSQASEDDRSEPTSPEFVEDKENEGVDHSGPERSDEGEDEGPMDLRKKPSSEKGKTVNSGSTNGGSHHHHGVRPEAATPASAETILDIFQRTLMTAGLPPYLSPLLFLGGASASEDLAKAMAERVLPPEQIPYPYRTLLPNASDLMSGQPPVVRDPYGRRHILVQSSDGNVVTIPLSSDNVLSEYEKSVGGGGSKATAFKKRDYYAQKEREEREREEEDAYVERYRVQSSVREKDSYPPSRRDNVGAYNSVRPKSELVSRLESAPVLSQLDYLSSERRGHGVRRNESSRAALSRDSEPEDLSLAGSDASNEDDRGRRPREWDAYSHRGRWGQPAPEEEEEALEEEARRRFFRSRSCSDLLKFKSMEERERSKAADSLTPASLSCPSLAATTSSRWRENEPSDHHRHSDSNHNVHNHHHHHRKRKYVTHHEDRREEEGDDEGMVIDYDNDVNEREQQRQQQPEIVNAPITRLFNPKKNATAIRPKMPRLLKAEENVADNERLRDSRERETSGYTERSEHHLHRNHRFGTSRYNEDDEDDEVLRESIRQQTRLASEMSSDGSRMTPEQEETFLERLRHTAPVPWNVYSYYTQMMRNLTEPRHPREVVYHHEDKRPSSNVSSPSPHRSLHNQHQPSHQTVTSIYQPSRSPDTTNASPPNSLLVAAIASGIGNGNGNGVVPPGSPSLPDSRKAARVLTGKHVRQGTGASPATLLTLRQKIQERQRAKETSSQTTTSFGRSNAKVGRDLKRKNQLPPSIPLVNKSR